MNTIGPLLRRSPPLHLVNRSGAQPSCLFLLDVGDSNLTLRPILTAQPYLHSFFDSPCLDVSPSTNSISDPHAIFNSFAVSSSLAASTSLQASIPFRFDVKEMNA